MVLVLNEEMLPVLQSKLAPFIKHNRSNLLKVFGILKATVEGKWMDSEFIVDKWTNFTTVIVRPKKIVKFQFTKQQHYWYTTNPTVLEKMLRTPGVIDWRSGLHINNISYSIKPFVEKAVKQSKQRYEFTRKGYFFPYYGSKAELKFELPSGFTLSSLDSKYADKALAAWKFGRPEALPYLAHCLQYFPSSALLDEKNELVAFVLMYHLGSMGILFVEPKFQKRKFSKIVMKHLMSLMIDCGYVPFGETEISNKVSYNLQRSLGMDDGEITELCVISASPEAVNSKL